MKLIVLILLLILLPYFCQAEIYTEKESLLNEFFEEYKEFQRGMKQIQGTKRSINDINLKIDAFKSFAPLKDDDQTVSRYYNLEKNQFYKQYHSLLSDKYSLIEDKLFPSMFNLYNNYLKLNQLKNLLLDLNRRYKNIEVQDSRIDSFIKLTEIMNTTKTEVDSLLQKMYNPDKQSESELISLQNQINYIGLYRLKLDYQYNDQSIVPSLIKNKDSETGVHQDFKSLSGIKKEEEKLVELLKQEKNNILSISKEISETRIAIQEMEKKVDSMHKELEDFEKKQSNPYLIDNQKKILQVLYHTKSLKIEGYEVIYLYKIKAKLYILEQNKAEISANIKRLENDHMELENKWDSLLTSKIYNGIVNILVVIMVAFLLLMIANRVGKRLIKYFSTVLEEEHHQKRASTLYSITLNTMRLLIWIVSILVILRNFDIDYKPFLVAAGGISVAIGFGAQSLIKDFFAGFCFLIENQFQIGDIVTINDKTGTVEKITLRTTTIRDYEDGAVWVFPNGQISFVANLTKLWSRTRLYISVDYKSDINFVKNRIEEICIQIFEDEYWKNYIMKKPEVLGISSLNTSSIDFHVTIETKPGEHWAVAREFRKRIKLEFDKAGIEIPYPHLVIQNKI
ncbi:MAG: mechanosensitive ion channel [Candidatus Coatesbacteria bacterium]|nr:mechanosensitive ion channel [Candidatus Coatesbacteria bacterium]